MTVRLRWTFYPGSDIQAPLYCAGDYVISERWRTELRLVGPLKDTAEYVKIGQFTLSYRPTGKHIPLGTFESLSSAKRAASKHNRNLLNGRDQ